METFIGIIYCRIGDNIFNLRQTIIAENHEMAYNILQSDVVWNTHFTKDLKVINYGLVE